MSTTIPLYGFGRGGGSGGTLTVTAPAGVTVTVSKDGKSYTKTADSSGVAVFQGLKSGTWTVTAADGSRTAVRAVEVTTDYSTAVSFETYLFNYGNQEYTWSAKAMIPNSGVTAKKPTATAKDDGSVSFGLTNSTDSAQYAGGYGMDELVDLTHVNTITIDCGLYFTGTGTVGTVRCCILPEDAKYFKDDQVAGAVVSKSDIASSTLVDKTVTIDVSSITGSYKIFIGVFAGAHVQTQCRLREVIAE